MLLFKVKWLPVFTNLLRPSCSLVKAAACPSEADIIRRAWEYFSDIFRGRGPTKTALATCSNPS